MKYYHLSEINRNGKTLRPRVPSCADIDGDEKTKRVCFSTNIKGSLVSIVPVYFHYYPFDFYVHVPDGYEGRIVKPTEDQVFDVKKTREKWFTDKVKLKCIGKVRCCFNRDNKLRYKWIEKY